MLKILRYKILPFIILSLVILSCREEYISPVNPESQNLLVVEGFLDFGDEPTIVRLSRTARLYDSILFKPETAAQVYVESDMGARWDLFSIAPGVFQAPAMTHAPGANYRLVVNTFDGKTYASDYVPYVESPAIDSISWIQNRDKNVEIKVTTHNDNNDTRYYRWDYTETWEFHSSYFSDYFYEFPGRGMVERPWAERDSLYFCWKTIPSSEIIISNTSKQEQDIVKDFTVKLIKNGEQRLSVRYHIRLKQYGLTKEAFEYWQGLKKNTEGMGSIFDPQPSVNVSNIRNINNPDEAVIGFISAGKTSASEIFINRNQLQDWRYTNFCPELLVINLSDSLKLHFGNGSLIPTYALYDENFRITHYVGASATCVDCRLTGSPVKPSFW